LGFALAAASAAVAAAAPTATTTAPTAPAAPAAPAAALTDGRRKRRAGIMLLLSLRLLQARYLEHDGTSN